MAFPPCTTLSSNQELPVCKRLAYLAVHSVKLGVTVGPKGFSPRVASASLYLPPLPVQSYDLSCLTVTQNRESLSLHDQTFCGFEVWRETFVIVRNSKEESKQGYFSLLIPGWTPAPEGHFLRQGWLTMGGTSQMSFVSQVMPLWVSPSY